jgi:hypothetical protein
MIDGLNGAEFRDAMAMADNLSDEAIAEELYRLAARELKLLELSGGDNETREIIIYSTVALSTAASRLKRLSASANSESLG